MGEKREDVGASRFGIALGVLKRLATVENAEPGGPIPRAVVEAGAEASRAVEEVCRGTDVEPKALFVEIEAQAFDPEKVARACALFSEAMREPLERAVKAVEVFTTAFASATVFTAGLSKSVDRLRQITDAATYGQLRSRGDREEARALGWDRWLRQKDRREDRRLVCVRIRVAGQGAVYRVPTKQAREMVANGATYVPKSAWRRLWRRQRRTWRGGARIGGLATR